MGQAGMRKQAGGCCRQMTAFFCPLLSTADCCTAMAAAADSGTASRIRAVFSLFQSNICSIYAFSLSNLCLCAGVMEVARCRARVTRSCVGVLGVDRLATLLVSFHWVVKSVSSSLWLSTDGYWPTSVCYGTFCENKAAIREGGTSGLSILCCK